jgi:(p)ppGpp synthase/HD superfamily hydrolase
VSSRPGPTSGLPARSGPADDLVGRADRFAAERHAGQTDKAGAPYIGHPRRVAARLAAPTEQAVALLHDVLEDTGTTTADLRAAGFPEVVVEAVDRLTRRADEPVDSYLHRVAGSTLALAVKRADIADNADEARMARIPDPATRARLTEKYRHALAVLDGSATSGPEVVP